MKSLASFLVALFAAATLALGLIAWRQHSELIELRASALDRGERAALQKRLWDLEKVNRTLQDQVASTRSSPESDPAAPGNSPDAGSGRRPPERGARGESGLQQAAALRELMSRPEVQAMINQQQKAGIEARYAPLFKLLNLNTDQAAKLTSLLAERNTTRQDVFAAAQEQGINPRSNPEAFRKLLADAQNELNRGIQSVIGERGLEQLQNFEQTVPQRALVGELQQRLSYTSNPLTPTQSEQLIQILAKNSPPRPASSDAPQPGVMTGRVLPVDLLGGGPSAPGASTLPGVIESAFRVGGAPISNAAVSEAQVVLSPPQLATLQQMQQQQQAQQQLQQMFREAAAPTGTRTPPAGEGSPTQAAPKQRRPGG